MKNKFILVIILAISTSIFAQTQVSGSQSGTWYMTNSPYNVIGEIIVPSGEILTIEPGVEINFQGYYKFTVQGNLQALGTETDSIFFTTDNQSVGWGGIRFYESDGISNLSYCRIEFGKTSGDYPDIHGGGMALLTSDAVVSNCVFADNDATGEDNGMGGAVYGINTGSMSGPLTLFTDCKFIRNHAYGEGGAIKFTSDYNSEIMHCEFIDNTCNYGGGGISLYSVYGTKMIYCLFANNYTMYSNGGAVHSLGIGNTMEFENCTMYGNEAVTGDGGAVYLAYAEATFINCIIYDNPGSYSDDIFISIGSSAEINYSNLTMPDGSTGSNNINEDPLFIDVTNLNFQLQEDSPCIDTGLDIGYEYNGDAPDMGCFEHGLPTSILSNKNNVLLLYPNPVKDVFTIQNTVNMVSLSITDVTGKIIMSRQFGGVNNASIDLSEYNNGVYIVNVQTDTEAFTAKIIKE